MLGYLTFGYMAPIVLDESEVIKLENRAAYLLLKSTIRR